MVQFTASAFVLAAMGAIAGTKADCEGPDVNQATLDLIKSFESWQPDIYIDPTGNPSVGYGHLCSDSSCSDVSYSIPLSEADGDSLLHDDLHPAQQCITLGTSSSVTLNANQYGALVSWAFNVGCGNAGSSTLIKRLNNGEDDNTVIEEELPKWTKSAGSELPGLVRRRNSEVDLAETPTDDGALPVGC